MYYASGIQVRSEIIVMKRVEAMGSQEVGGTKKLEAEPTGINVGVKKSGLLSRYS